ncbi:MAG: hypothetical protein ACXVNN_11120 [Bacteroidia bacterium]
MNRNKNYILLFGIIFSHVFGFYFLSTSMISVRKNNISNSENSFDLLRFVKRRREKYYTINTENSELSEGIYGDPKNEETQKSITSFFKYIKRLYDFFNPAYKETKHQVSSIPSKFLISPPAFNVAYNCFLI